MIRHFQIAVFVYAALLAGCNKGERQPDLKGVKIGDIAPMTGNKQTNQTLKTINFDFVTFELPAEKIGSLNEVWAVLKTEPLRLADANAFAENSFRAGAGQGAALDRVVSTIASAGGKKMGATLLLVPDGQAETLNIVRLSGRTILSYVASGGSLQHIDIGPGTLGLRITARKLAGSRALCNIQAMPVFSPSTEGLAPQLAARVRAGEFQFTPVGFGLRMKPGDFILLAPQQHIADRSKLGGLFFATPAGKPSVTVLLLICTGVV